MKTVIVGKSELARFLGLTKQGLIKRQATPPPDMTSVNGRPIWYPKTATEWDAAYTAAHPAGKKPKN